MKRGLDSMGSARPRWGRSRGRNKHPWYVTLGGLSSCVMLVVSLFMLGHSLLGLEKSQVVFTTLTKAPKTNHNYRTCNRGHTRFLTICGSERRKRQSVWLGENCRNKVGLSGDVYA